MPFKLTKTTPANLPWGKSVQFNGTNQYLTAGAASNWTFLHNGSSWTAECWFNVPSASLSNQYTLVSTNAESANIGTVLTLNNTTSGDVRAVVYKGVSGQTAMNVTTNSGSFTPNTWNHLATVYNSITSVGTVYINGVAIASASGSGFSTNAPTYNLAIGRYQAATPAGYLNGYISNLRIANSVLYTASFTPPTSPLNVVANTSLLACHDTSFKDGSVNNFAITTVGTPSISTATPFVVSTKSVQFNGVNQYLSLSRVLDNSTDFTVEAWVRVNSTPPVNSGYIVSQYVSAGADRTIFSVRADLTVLMQFGATNVGSTTVLALNTWYHLAWVRNGSGANNCSIYINGVRDGQLTYTGTFQNTPTTIGGSNNLASTYFPGYISNLRIVKGTALYTASFTALAEPLTAIANTSLLTCNAATIVDGSSNNFTITNNNGATVSSVVPFNAVGYGYKFKNVSSTAAKRNFNFSKSAVTLVYLTQKAIFGYGNSGATNYSITNLVSNTGVVASNTTGVGTARTDLAAAGYGSDKAMFGYGSGPRSMTNLVSNTGVVATDTTGVGTARYILAAAGYGTDKAIFGYGYTTANVSMTNLVSNTGVVSTDTTGVGTSRYGLAAAGYGTDKAIFGYGTNGSNLSMTNLISNTGVVSTDTTGVGTARRGLAAASYGSDKAIFGYGYTGAATAITNLVSNTGVVATDTTGVGTARYWLAAAGYGTDKAIFGYGQTSVALSMTNLVSNTGVVATDTAGVGTARNGLAAAGYSLT